MKSRILLIFLFAAALLAHLAQISDPDLFWHLATGRWIWEHGRLPDSDLFNYTTSIKAYEEFFMARIISRQYWLANLLQYGAHNLAGYWGILCLRLVFAFLTLLMAYLSLRKKGLSVIASVLLLVPLEYVIISFQGDRPNQMTFFFIAAFIYLIENLKAGCMTRATGYSMQDGRTVANHESCIVNHGSFSIHRTSGIMRQAVLPLLMLFWANMHGGFIFGTVIAGIYLISELLRTLLAGGHRTDRRLIITLSVTIFAGLLNPNGYNVIYALIRESSPFQEAGITELMTPFAHMRLGLSRYFFEVCAYVAAAGISVVVCSIGEYYRIRAERCSINDTGCTIHGSEDRLRNANGVTNPLLTSLLSQTEYIFLIVLFGFLSFTAVRFIPLLVLVLTPVIGRMFSGKPDLFLKRLSRFMIPEAALVCIIAYGALTIYPLTVLKQPLMSDYYPGPAVRFIKNSGLWGRLFNYYDWGGFLIWNFYPDKVVFMDGRSLSQRAHLQYLSVIAGVKEEIIGMPAYKAVLDAYSVRNILIPATSRDGGLVPLILILESDPEWKLIFYAKNCLFYTREKFDTDVPKVVAYAIAMENAYTLLGDNPRPYLTIARANLGLGRRGDAIEFLKSVLKGRPSLKGGPVERALKLMNDGRDILREYADLP